MKKIKLEILEQIGYSGHGKKYRTQIDNVYIYHVQLGSNHDDSILLNQNEPRAEEYGEKSVIVTYSDYLNHQYCGIIKYITYTYGIKSKYYV